MCGSVLAPLAVAVAVSTPAAAGTSGLTGPVHFPASDPTCHYAGRQLTDITVAAPTAKARAHWVSSKFHSQDVVYNTILLGYRGHGAVTIATSKSEITTVTKTFKKLTPPAGFPSKADLAENYDAFRLEQQVRFYSATTGHLEGHSAKTLARYSDSGTRVWCVRAHPTVTTPTLAPVTIGQQFSTQLSASGVGPFTWALTNGTSLPTGLTLTASGTLSGSVAGSVLNSASGNTSIAVTATDANERVARHSYRLGLAYTPGDVTGNGAVDCSDIEVAYANQGIPSPSYVDGDVNGDGHINNQDLNLITADLASGVTCEVAASNTSSIMSDPTAPPLVTGDTILTGTVVSVACRVNAATTDDDTDSWYYRLNSAPWVGEYAAAEDFEQPTADSPPGRGYDSSVPTC